MNYASRLGLVHFMRRDPNGIRRDPRCRDVVVYAARLGFWCMLRNQAPRERTGSDGIPGYWV